MGLATMCIWFNHAVRHCRQYRQMRFRCGLGVVLQGAVLASDHCGNRSVAVFLDRRWLPVLGLQ